MNNFITPLPQRTIPLPWEDLASLISRVSELMGYRAPEWVLNPQEAEHKIVPSQLPFLYRRVDYLLLEQLLSLDEETIYQLTLHRFAKTLGSPTLYSQYPPIDRPLLTPYYSKSLFLPSIETKICPLCLDEDVGYDRLYWRIRCMVICPQHSCLLVDKCPRCNSHIPALRASLLNCPKCQLTDYRKLTPFFIAEDSFLRIGEAVLLRFFGINYLVQMDISTAFMESPFLSLSSRQYFSIFTHFGTLLTYASSPKVFPFVQKELDIHREIPSYTKASLSREINHIILFHWVFSYWPNHFLAFLEVLYRALIEVYHHNYRGEDWARVMACENYWIDSSNSSSQYLKLHQFFRDYGKYFQYLLENHDTVPW